MSAAHITDKNILIFACV